MTDRRTFNPLDHGLYERFLVGKRGDGDLMLNTAAWGRAVASGEHVGSCRRCGNDLVALPTNEHNKVTWYTGRCLECGWEFASPGGEVLRRSSRHDEMPQGYWEKRSRAKKQGNG